MDGCDKLVSAGRRAFFARTAAVAAGAAAARLSRPARRRRPPVRTSAGELSGQAASQSQGSQGRHAGQHHLSRRRQPRRVAQAGQPRRGRRRARMATSSPSARCARTRGIPLFYRADDRSLSCPGHYSRFDVEKGGQQIWGHATQNLPQFRLRIDANGDIHAVSVDELIYGRLSNVCRLRGATP